MLGVRAARQRGWPVSRTHSTEHQTCGACGSTFPATYWHECPGDQITERVAQEIAAWVESSRGKRDLGLQTMDRTHVERLARAIREGAWRAASPGDEGESR